MHRSTFHRTVAALVVVALAVWIARSAGLFGLHDRASLGLAIERARSMPFLPIVFVATYAFGAAVGVPATPLTLAGGALFGAPRGIGLNWLGELLAALLAFGIVRATGLHSRRAVAASADPVSRPRTRVALFRLRLIPVVPFALLNAGAAISGMSLRDYTIATATGIIPITVIYTIAASELIAGVEGSGTRALTTAGVAAAVLVGLSFLPALVQRLTTRRERH